MSEYKCLKCGYEGDDEIDFIRSVHKNQKLLCNDCSEEDLR